MYTDERINAALETMLGGIDAPPVPLPDIRRKIAQPQAVVRHTPRYLRLAIATVGIIAIVFVALPSQSLNFIQSLEARYRAALQAKGGYAPPPIPESLQLEVLKQAERSPDVSLTNAQSRVPFTIVPPTGLPHDIVSARIRTAPTWVYSTESQSWRVGPSFVTFIYRRSGHRSFQILADQFDPKSGSPGKYVFEAKPPAPNGSPVIVRHEIFHWRNGDQVMSAIAGADISAPEIHTIVAAMHGVAIPGSWPAHTPAPGADLKGYPATEP
ncbi:MAG: hypothetical protein M3007_07830 [Candidatus Eremiobacteraeota bacterium]|nr:hypothetical protein [Candidatus Eremiobacteraeota bacterium]